jgi:hypothetical protein
MPGSRRVDFLGGVPYKKIYSSLPEKMSRELAQGMSNSTSPIEPFNVSQEDRKNIFKRRGRRVSERRTV